MKRRLSAIVTLAIALGGCAAQRHPASSSTAATSPPTVAAQHKNSGWYLMQPPKRHRDVTDTSAPMADWQVLAFFDRASQCDAARAQGLSAYASYLPVSGSGAIDSVQMSQRLASSTLCVAADDPRINWFHLRRK